MSEARFGIAFGAVGIAADCLQVALDYSTNREQFGKPIAGFQLTQAKIADMMTDLTNAQLQAYRLAQLKDTGMIQPVHISMAKRHNVRIALNAARSARTILGANGVSTEYSPIRHMMNLESVLTYEGTEEIHTLVLGQSATHLPAFR